ncbi:MAG: FtsX-like permease family protein [Myxococcota bacterium]
MVALVIINNALVTATMERTTEIGTLRAIGAQRGQILLMFFIETLLLGLAAAALGAAAGGALVLWWGSAGLPAPNRALQFVFGGPELFPALSLRHILTAGGAILVIGLLSTAYPAWLGARVPPVEAMRAEE